VKVLIFTLENCGSLIETSMRFFEFASPISIKTLLPTTFAEISLSETCLFESATSKILSDNFSSAVIKTFPVKFTTSSEFPCLKENSFCKVSALTEIAKRKTKKTQIFRILKTLTR
jgi:hypothetical protein